MHFLLGFLLGYHTRNKPLLAATLTQAADELKESVWEGTVPREQLLTFKTQFNVISSRTFDGQARVRVISKDQRPSGEFIEAMPILEDYYVDLVNRPD